MRNRWIVCVLVLVVGVMVAQDARCEVHHRIGAGVRYWTALDDIEVDDADADENGLGYVISYQLRPASLIKFGVDVEVLAEDYATSEHPVYAPQAYIIVGGGLYAGLGIGGYYTDGEFGEDPFYNLRAGLDFALLPFIYLDLNANYRFEEWDDIKTVDEDISTDTITIGATVRLQI